MNYIEEANSILKDYSNFMTSIIKRTNKFKGLKVIIPYGYYKNRIGKITSVCVTEGSIYVLIQPFRLRGKGDELLWDHNDARKFYNILSVKSIFKGD